MAPNGVTSRESHFVSPFLSALDAASSFNAKDCPNYYAQDPKSLVATSTVHSFTAGTGLAIYKDAAKLLESTAHELILVTCFFVRCESMNILNDVLRNLSDKAIRRGSEKIKVRICFSSSSIFQKLFHTQKAEGQLYDPAVWAKKLGLPPPDELGGLDMRVKSIFLFPISIMHPKFMIIDRRDVLLPSCNISWEAWFEGCIHISGPICDHFLSFYHQFWARQKMSASDEQGMIDATIERRKNGVIGDVSLGPASTTTGFATKDIISTVKDIPTIFLPSPHHRNPRYRPFVAPENIRPPPTPLNTFLVTLFAKAERNIYIQSPNITAPPVLTGLLRALERGIDVSILTSEKLQVIEQIFTTGTTTKRYVRRLIKRYKTLLSSYADLASSDEEAVIGSPKPGRLEVRYFQPFGGPRPKGQEEGEPQQSHLKMTIVDDEVVVLGSGNMDRPSWFTSQELGVAFFDAELVKSVQRLVKATMDRRSKVEYVSSGTV